MPRLFIRARRLSLGSRGRFRQRVPTSERLELPRAAGIAARQSAKARQAALAREGPRIGITRDFRVQSHGTRIVQSRDI